MSVYSAPWYTPAVQRLLDLSLEEDVGRGDVTTSSVIDETQEAEAEIIARERAVVCGLGVVEAESRMVFSPETIGAGSAWAQS